MTSAPSVTVRWRGGALAFASAHGDVMRVTPASRLAQGAACWSPEELLSAAVAASFAVTLVELAERTDVPLVDATAQAACHVSDEGIERVRIDAALETLHGCEDRLHDTAAAATEFLVGEALRVPVEVHVQVTATEGEARQVPAAVH